MELFDFAKLIGGYIQFAGSFSLENTYVNATLNHGYHSVSADHPGRSVFGRSETPDLDEALTNLARELSGRKIFTEQRAEYRVPEPLKHTRGYRGKPDPTNPIDETRPERIASNALKVILLTEETNKYLRENDPQALKQVKHALKALGV